MIVGGIRFVLILQIAHVPILSINLDLENATRSYEHWVIKQHVLLMNRLHVRTLLKANFLKEGIYLQGHVLSVKVCSIPTCFGGPIMSLNYIHMILNISIMFKGNHVEIDSTEEVEALAMKRGMFYYVFL